MVLNACYSESQADALLAHIDCVVGMSGAIHDDAARSFAIGFYGGLGERESVAAAYMQGRAAISLQGLRDSDLPQLRVRAGVDASQLVFAAARQASSRGPAVARRTSRSSNRGILRDLDSGRMFLVRRQPWGRAGLAIAATTLAGAAASIAATWPRAMGENGVATGDAPASAVEVADASGGAELEARRQPPGMRWLHAADVQLGTPPVELQRLRERCKAIAGRELCEHFERIGYWSREAPRRMHIEGFFLDVREVTAGEFAKWLTSRRDARVRGEWIEIDGARVARTHQLILYDEGAADRFRVRDGYADYPMVGVTWEGARRMCAWRSARLPSGAQWERAARGAGGDRLALDEGPRSCTDVLIAGCVGAASIQPSGYGVRDITFEGIVDLLGSVSEWTSDPDERPGAYEIRGGAYSLPWLLARPASRLFLDGTNDDVGFRCAAAPHGATG